MSTFDGQSYYFSGQGVVMVGKRDATGKSAGLIPVANVSDLKISLATTVTDHKESQSGTRGTDKRLTTDLKASLSMTIESFTAVNLALALRGDESVKLAGSVTSEAPKGYWGKVVPLKYAQVASVVAQRGSGPSTLTVFVADGTAYDYKLNADAGSIMLNDGQGASLLTSNATANGVVPSAVTVGNPTRITVANTAVAGDRVALAGFAGADAALLNAKAHKIVAATLTYVDIELNTTGKTITIGAPLAVFDGYALSIDYTYGQQNVVQALTQVPQERYLRFEGLNTADDNRPVIVEIFRFEVDPLRELALIGDNIAQFVLEGSVLYDALQSTGSKYFKQTLLR